MMQHTYLIPRDSNDEVTVAVLQVEFSSAALDGNLQTPTNLLHAVRDAVTAWVKETDEGREAWEESSEDFNVGDLCNYDLEPINERLKAVGIEIVELDAFTMDANNGPWSFDTKLVDETQLEQSHEEDRPPQT